MEKTIIPSYKAGLTELRSQLKEMLQQEALNVFDADASYLQESHTSILKLKAGDKAPGFSLPNATGKTVSLKDELQTGAVVLIFYRGNWCPYCNLQLSQYQQILDEIKEVGASLIAISPQTPDASLDLKEKNELKFDVLSDKSNSVARQFTTVFKNADNPVNAMAELGYDFDSFYGDDSREIPVPAVFIINREGIITFAKTEGGDYRNRVEPGEVIESLKNM